MAVPSYDQLMRPTLDALRTLGGSASIGAILLKVQEQLELPPEIAAQPHLGHPGMTELEYRLHWARTYLKRYGLIENPVRGTWALTELGIASQNVEPSEIVRVVKKQMREESAAGQPSTSASPIAGSTVERTSAPVPSVSSQSYLSLTPNLPTYPAVRHFMRLIDGAPYSLYRSMYNGIWEQRGNPQETVDWADPDQWDTTTTAG